MLIFIIIVLEMTSAILCILFSLHMYWGMGSQILQVLDSPGGLATTIPPSPPCVCGSILYYVSDNSTEIKFNPRAAFRRKALLGPRRFICVCVMFKEGFKQVFDLG